MSKLFRFMPFAIGILACAVYLVPGEKPWFIEAEAFTRDVRESERTRAFLVDGMYWAAAVNLVLLAITGAVFSLFWPGSQKPLSEKRSEVSRKGKRFQLGLIVVLIGFAGWQNSQRLGHSLWGDEESTTQKEILGMVWPEKDGPGYRIKPVSWQKTLWNWDRGPGNQVAYSAAARLAHGPAEPGDVSDPHAQHISEWKLRVPALIAGLGCLGAVAWLLTILGFARAAPVAVALIALHPWFVRWGSEARGYSFVMFLAPLAVVLLIKGVKSARWGWWIALGMVQFLLLWSHLGSLYFLIALNGIGLLYGWSAHRTSQPIWQLAISSLIGAVLTIQMMGPLAKQLLNFLEKDPLSGEIGGSWLANWLSFWTTGMPLQDWDSGNPFSITAPTYALVVILVPLLWGVIQFLRHREVSTRWIVAILLLPAPLFVAHSIGSGSLIYPWYVVGYLPLFLAVAAVGASRHWAGSVLVVALFAVVSHEQRQHFIDHPIEPLRESVAATREVTNPWHPDFGKNEMTLGTIHPTRLYDPGMIYAVNDEQVDAAIQTARDEGKRLSMNGANMGLALGLFPRMAAELAKPDGMFQETEVIYGQFIPATTRYIYRVELDD